MLCLLVAAVTLAGFSLLSEAFVLPRAANTSTLAPLRFNSSGLFQISTFNDLHYGENEDSQWAPDADLHTDKVLTSILTHEHQSLVAINGDLITGENTYVANSSRYVDRIVAPLIRRRLPWASTYGNHDSDYNLSRTDILAREKTLGPKLSYTRSDVAGRLAGVSNYYLPVFGSNDTDASGPPAAILWFFDSRGGNYYRELDAAGNRVPQPNWVDQSVVDWFQQTHAQLNRTYGGTAAAQIPSIAFVHIPIKAFQAMQATQDQLGGTHNFTEPGINEDYLAAAQADGWTKDGQTGTAAADGAYGGQDVPFMRALLATGGLQAVFSGHDHGCDWCWKWSGTDPDNGVAGNGQISLCFGRHTGYGGYSNWERGSRQILLSERLLKQNIVETWVRLEKGEVVGNVVLNSTYGTDRYPATPWDQTYCTTCDYS